jgi:osmoprotectant transport system permease protein
MIKYALENSDKLGKAMSEHMVLVGSALSVSLLLAAVLTIFAMYSKILSSALIHAFSVIYSIPSLALFALLIPVTGLGKETAIIVLVIYNQYLLLRNFISGLNGVDPSIVEAATGMGMTKMQILIRVRLSLSKRALITGVRLAIISTIGIATIAASINAGGLGSILFDGLRTMNVYKILWGSILTAGLSIFANSLLSKIEQVL